MLRAACIRPAGSFDIEDAETITLDYDGRYRRRITLQGDAGTRFMLDLPEATVLSDGDGLELESGKVIIVRAAAEPLLEIRGATARHLMRLAWHIGNRHLPAAISDGRILIRRDHVIAEMIIGLGGNVREVEASFEPEGGAYAWSDGHDHTHSHEH